MMSVTFLLSGCSFLDSKNENTDITQNIDEIFKDNNGDFDWTINKFTSKFPEPQTGKISQYLINSDKNYCSLIIENFSLENTKSYIELLNEYNVSSEKYQIYDDSNYPILNYLGKLDNYNISISQSDNSATVVVSVCE